MSSKNLAKVAHDFKGAEVSITKMIDKVVNKITEKAALTAQEKFFVVCVVMRDQFSKPLTRYQAVDLINARLIADLHAYPQSCVPGESRLSIADQLHKAYNTNSVTPLKKGFDLDPKAFEQIQSSYTLRSSMNFIEAKVSIMRNNRKRLITFNLCKPFLNFLQSQAEQVKIIDAYALGK